MVAIILMLLIPTVFLSGCTENEPTVSYEKFDNGNILVTHYEPSVSDENYYLEITILIKGNYTIYLAYTGKSYELKHKTLVFNICSVPYQYKFERFRIYSYDLIIVEKEYR